MAPMRLFTIGYEGTEIADFIEHLLRAGVSTVVDVRDLPLSRKRGFSKNGLRSALGENGLEYVHCRALGAPKPLRDALRQGGSWSQYTIGYEAVLNANQDAIAELARQVEGGDSIALLCFEADERTCHRSLVARAVRACRPAIAIQHLRPAQSRKPASAFQMRPIAHD